MPSTTCIIYSSVDGQTKKICDRIRIILEDLGESVVMTSATNLNQPQTILHQADKIILASSIRYGKHSKQITTLIESYHGVLNSKISAFISVNLVARKKEKSSFDTNPYVIKFLQSIPWKPTKTAVFAGKLNYPSYKFWDRFLIRLIMKLTKGPTDPNTVIEYTDWSAVENFAKKWYQP
ncbi:menaquinone-dependent protoporphyrinogen IX dehydrogenase [Mongoliitalea daihaiensis]|uniref:menaquinone-dependent protoporphyrinogen IX dehydrogenase n=1 Tax=Mongoliitalea daihaiensis TaxID=2782006 RepID=UPI001F3116C7|nr:menaquinone-dependent protoporphyrinogen IX dehydrogenase [Mongoliitalea daihaiensis]UJP65000.1 menaquinone-dependent protoporphyrinogen IX dehydrogenase [Mongoliitalea daihaiensis]